VALRGMPDNDNDQVQGGCDSIIGEFSVAGFGLLGALSKNKPKGVSPRK